MTQRGENERLRRALSALPGPSASADFTPRLMARIDRRAARRRAWRPMLWAAALLAVGVLGGIALLRPPTPAEPRIEALSTRAEELRREQLRLRQELEALRGLADDTAPVLYLGSEADYDLVVDLRPLMATASPAAQPAAYRPDAGPEANPRR